MDCASSCDAAPEFYVDSEKTHTDQFCDTYHETRNYKFVVLTGMYQQEGV